MNTDRDNRNRLFFAVDRAFKTGGRAALESVLGNPPDFPNCRMPDGLGVGAYPLDYAIYWSPLPFIIELIEAGAELNHPADDGFPSLMAALASDRINRLAVLSVLLENGADTGQRGINDWTPLHYAVVQRDLPAVEILLDYGADPKVRTRIDDCTTPYEDAVTTGFTEAAAVMDDVSGRRIDPDKVL
jgi:uncharacterized protein